MVLVKQIRPGGRLSVKSFCLIGALFTCISIFRYYALNLSHSSAKDDIAFEAPYEYGSGYYGDETEVESFVLSNEDPHADKIFTEGVNPRRVDISCCGIGHRFEIMGSAARDLSPSPIEVNWGPCEHSSNIFGELFKSNNAFIPFNPSEGDLPFPEVRYLSSLGIDAGQKKVPLEVERALVDLLLHKLSDKYMDKVQDFKNEVGWDETTVIGLHIRTGNVLNNTSTYERETTQLHRRVGGRLQEEIGLENALYLYMKHARALAAKMGASSDNYRVLVVTDSNDVLETLGSMSGLPNWFHRPQSYTDVAHPLVYGNLRLNNSGDRVVFRANHRSSSLSLY